MKFTVGNVLNRTFQIFFQNLPVLLVIGFVAYLPSVVLGYLSGPDTQLGLLWFVSLVVSFLSAFIVQGIIVYGVYESITSGRFPLDRSVGVALRRLGPIVMVSVISGILTWLGFMLLVIPGIIVMTALWVAVPVTVVEKKGVMDSINRSRRLTVGFRLRILGLLVVIWLITFGLNILSVPVSAAAPVIFSVLVNYLITIVTGALAAVSAVVGYYHLRIDVEGLELRDLISVFE